MEKDHDDIIDFSKPIPGVSGPMAGVFWDVEYYPFHESDPDLIYEKIENALDERGYSGIKKSIWAYVDHLDKPKGSQNEFLGKKTWKGSIYFVPGGNKPARRDRMLHDIFLWAIDTQDHPAPVYLFVISNKVCDDIDFFQRLQVISLRRFSNVYVSEPLVDFPPETSEWPGSIFDQVWNVEFLGQQKAPNKKLKL